MNTETRETLAQLVARAIKSRTPGRRARLARILEAATLTRNQNIMDHLGRYIALDDLGQSQEEQCADCYFHKAGACNVMLKDGETCGDKLTSEQHDFAEASGDFNL